ncbi:MAG: STAS domain-containing protein [Lachnospiraceae bacterium]|nr:STAS domain-containing protein [Lachnospiraceae bacterium]
MKEICEKRGNKLYVTVPIELDHVEADQLRQEVERMLVDAVIREVIFDFRNTVFMDSSGIGMLMGRQRSMQQMGGCVRVIHAGERIQRILELSGVYKVITIN